MLTDRLTVTTTAHEGAERPTPAGDAERPTPAGDPDIRIPTQRGGSGPARAPRRLSARVLRAAWLTLPPLAAFTLGNLMYARAASRLGEDYLDPATHQRFDALQYQDIAEHGYQVARCGDIGWGGAYGPEAWCGNGGWFPLYPLATRAVHAVTGWQWATAAVVTAQVATLAMFLLWWWVLIRVVPAPDMPRRGRWGGVLLGSRYLAVLTLGLLAPAGVYFYAGFPMSLAVGGSLAYVGLLARRHWVWAGLAGAVATMSYPVAGAVVASGVVTLAVMAWRREVPGWRRLTGAALAIGGIPAAGLLAVLAYQQATTGHWDAYLKVQSHYVGLGHNPVTNFFHLVVNPRGPGSPVDAPTTELLRFVSIAEMWVGLGLIVLVMAAAQIGGLRGRLAAVDVGLATLAPVMFLAPLLVGTQVSQYRPHLLMLPAVLVLRHLSGWLLWLSVPPLTGLAYWMGKLYFPSILW